MDIGLLYRRLKDFFRLALHLLPFSVKLFL